jgi:hypothetical protein
VSGTLLDLTRWAFLPHGTAGWIGILCGVVITGPFFGLANGGFACIQHLALRLTLWRSGAMPWNYAAFLDEAAERLLLRKVGGGYLFMHRLLLEYVAAHDVPPLLPAGESTDRPPLAGICAGPPQRAMPRVQTGELHAGSSAARDVGAATLMVTDGPAANDSAG